MKAIFDGKSNISVGAPLSGGDMFREGLCVEDVPHWLSERPMAPTVVNGSS